MIYSRAFVNICLHEGSKQLTSVARNSKTFHPASLSGAEALHFKIIEEWAKTTETGDRAEIAALPEKSTLSGQNRRPRRRLRWQRTALIFSTAVCRRCDGARLRAT